MTRVETAGRGSQHDDATRRTAACASGTSVLGGTAAAAFLASLQTLTDGAAPDADGLYVEIRDSTLTGRS